MNPLWSELLGTLDAYVPGEQTNSPDFVKLNTNENPFPPSPQVLAAISAAANAELRLYPDPGSSKLTASIAAHYGLECDQIFVGNGSDEVLAHAFLALLKHDRPLLFPDITYSFYPVYCSLYQIDYATVPLDQQFRINIADYERPNGGIIIPNPNAPTGIALPLDDLRKLLTNNPRSAVVVDEAYVDFGASSAVGLLAEFANLLVIQTVSKSRALAGLRVGFALGHRDLVAALELVKGCFNSYPLDRIAQVAATAAFADQRYFADRCADIIKLREDLARALAALDFDVLPSSANFLFVRHRRLGGADLQDALRAERILVRRFKQPRIADFLRITIGSAAQCTALVRSLEAIVGAR